MKRVAIFASGNGSNVENIANYFKKDKNVDISLIITNNPKAYVIERANRLNIPYKIVTKTELVTENNIIDIMHEYKIDFIVLAGFLLLIPKNLIEAYPSRIINIHPALLPKYGGSGMYGNNVHKAVIENGDVESGITIHFIDFEYDKGTILFQAKCPILPTDTIEDIATKIHLLEYKHFPRIIKKVLQQL